MASVMNFSALSPVAVAFPSPPILSAVSQHPDPWPSTYYTHMHYWSVEFIVSNTEISVISSDYNILKIIQHRFWLGNSKRLLYNNMESIWGQNITDKICFCKKNYWHDNFSKRFCKCYMLKYSFKLFSLFLMYFFVSGTD